jgi:glycosyltransferase involved in cell wall biosynthesis
MSTPIDSGNVYAVIPAYNENAVIESVVEALLPYRFHLIVVDDGSEIALYPLFKNSPVTILRHAVNMGRVPPSKQAEYIVTFDADGQHQSGDIETLLQKLRNNEANILLGSRFLKGAYHNMPTMRKIILHTARYLNFCLTGLLLSDAYNGMRAMNQTAAKSIHIRANGMAHATELLTQIKKGKLRYAEVPVSIHYTPYSRKKGLTTWSSFRIFFDILLNKIFK